MSDYTESDIPQTRQAERFKAERDSLQQELSALQNKVACMACGFTNGPFVCDDEDQCFRNMDKN